MGKTPEEMKQLYVHFYFKLEDLVKKKFKCEFGGGMESAFVKHVVSKYLEAGSPRAVNKWLASQDFLSHFVYMKEPPVWYEHFGVNYWPFHDGWPMIFFGQLDTQIEGMTPGQYAPYSLLTFGYKEYEDIGFNLHFTTILQNMDDGCESIEEHYRKENRRLRYAINKAKKEAENNASQEQEKTSEE